MGVSDSSLCHFRTLISLVQHIPPKNVKFIQFSSFSLQIMVGLAFFAMLSFFYFVSLMELRHIFSNSSFIPHPSVVWVSFIVGVFV